MNNKLNKTSESRRKTITAAVSSIVVGSVWYKPLVNSIVTPAHAQTSVASTSISGSSGVMSFVM